MDYRYNYYHMRLRVYMVRDNHVSKTDTETYSDWKSQFADYAWRAWPKFSLRFGETFQFALLRAMTVLGIESSNWDSLFGDILNESFPFDGITKAHLKGDLKVDWLFFAQKIAKETYKSIHYPAVYPEWLFPYGYSQPMYLQDLPIYWDNIHDDYYKPWDATKIGEDSPEVARMKRLGQVARQEIDEVGRHSQKHLKR
jgi:hypothetical protein